jgi:hypothetical protein
MRARRARILALVLLAATVAAVFAQSGPPVARTFAAPMDRVFAVAESALKSLGWTIDEKDGKAGWIRTDSRGVDFKDFGVYGQGTRHKLRLTFTAAGEGQMAVAVERELYKEERILWMTDRKPLEASDRAVELAVLDEIGRLVPAVAAAPGPAIQAPPAAGPERSYRVTYRVKGSAGSARLIYRNAQGGTEEATVRLPWEASFEAKSGSPLYVSVLNQGAAGTVSCEILLEEESRATSTSTGAGALAECRNTAERR